MLSESLLDSAVAQFGRNGFEGASTRAIAAASGTAMSSITYHFGGKHGLYLAAADHIAAKVAAMQGPALEAARAAAEASREAALEAVLGVIDSFAQMMMRPDSENWALFMIREQQAPTEAFDRLYRGIIQPVSELLHGLILRLRADLDPQGARATAILLFGQVLVLRAARASACRILGVESLDEPTRALLRRRLRANALSILTESPA